MPLPFPIVARFETDSQYYPLPEEMIPGMVSLMQIMADSAEVMVFERDYSGHDSQRSPAKGWRFDVGQVKFGHEGNEIYIDGCDTRIVRDDDEALNCGLTIRVVRGESYAITLGYMVRFKMDNPAGQVVELIFIRRPVATPPEPDPAG